MVVKSRYVFIDRSLSADWIIREFESSSTARAQEILGMIDMASRRDRDNKGQTTFLATLLNAIHFLRDDNREGDPVRCAVSDGTLPRAATEWPPSDWGAWEYLDWDDMPSTYHFFTSARETIEKVTTTTTVEEEAAVKDKDGFTAPAPRAAVSGMVSPTTPLISLFE